MTAVPHPLHRVTRLSDDEAFEEAVATAVRAAFLSATGIEATDVMDDVEREDLVGRLEELRGLLYGLLAAADSA